MVIPILFVIASGLSFTVLGLGYKYASVVKARTGAFGSVFAGAACCIGLARSLFETSAWGDWRLWALGLSFGLAFTLCFMLFTHANKIGPVSVSWVMLNLSSLMAIALSIGIFKEPSRWVDIPIVVLFIGMILLMNAGMREPAKDGAKTAASPLFWPCAIVAFGLNGLCLFIWKIKDQTIPEGSSGAILAISFGLAAVLLTVFHAVTTLRRQPREPLWRKEDAIAGLITGTCAVVGNIFLLGGMSLPAMVAYPISQGLPMVGGVVAMAIFFHERFNKAKTASLALSVVVLLLTIFREHIEEALLTVIAPYL